MNNISIIGIGKLGLSFALNLERKGYNVIGVDVNLSYVDQINNKTLKSDEPNVEEYLASSKNFIATTDISKALTNDLIFIVVATPSLEEGGYDHSHIDDVIKSLRALGKQPTKKYLVISSTVMPGYCSTLQYIKEYNYEVVYNPEFIAQGTIIKDQCNPDIVLIGSESEEPKNIIEEIYKKLCENNPSICKMSLMEAEITKIALNCFLTTKIAYANMVGDVASKTKCNPDVILDAVGKDSRIGGKYLKYGFGFGGPCFPRDNKAFALFCVSKNIHPYISQATDESNQSHLKNQISEFKKSHEFGESVVVEGVAFKKGSTIIEESQQLKFALELVYAGYDVTIKDCESVINQLKKIYNNRFKYVIA
jgi:nucleotide sugar dehydrogenase